MALPKLDLPRGRGETILVVEDDEDVRELTVALLEGFGYEVLVARDGKSGLAVLEESPSIDLLLTDMVMAGGMSGRDLANEAVRRFGQMRVLFMSGYTDVAVDLNGWVDKGFDTVAASCPVPIVVAGGKKVPEADALHMAYGAVQEGAAGVDMGRNIFQSENPPAMIQAVRKVVHENFRPHEAYEYYQTLKHETG